MESCRSATLLQNSGQPKETQGLTLVDKFCRSIQKDFCSFHGCSFRHDRPQMDLNWFVRVYYSCQGKIPHTDDIWCYLTDRSLASSRRARLPLISCRSSPLAPSLSSFLQLLHQRYRPDLPPINNGITQ